MSTGTKEVKKGEIESKSSILMPVCTDAKV